MKQKIYIWFGVGFVCVLCCVGVFLYFRLVLFSGKSHGSFSRAGKFAELIQPKVLYRIDDVIDGDTMIANVAGHEATLRLIGIDTPEVVDRRKPVQCFGLEASAEGKRLLRGAQVFIEKDPAKGDYDLYGRVLAYVRVPGLGLYNQYMLEHGFAREYTFHNEHYQYQADFRLAETKAKETRAGLWGKCPEG